MGKLIIIYGVNGVGKDAIALSLSREYTNSVVVSDQRILMYHLGIIDSYDNSLKIDKEKYKKLEDTSNEKFIDIYQNKFIQTLSEIKSNYDIVFLISHLVISLHTDKESPLYMDTESININLENLLSGIADGVFYIKSDCKDILKRREVDAKKYDRQRPLRLEDIKQHQYLNDKKWDEISKYVSENKKITILNDEGKLDKAISTSRDFIDNILSDVSKL